MENLEQSTEPQAEEHFELQAPCTERGIKRHEKILEAAGKIFTECGYDNANINEIVKVSGGSLGTVYKYFGNKLGLFEAYFKKTTEEVFSEFYVEDFWSDDLKVSLTRFGQALQKLMLKPDALAVYKLVLTDNSGDRAEIQRIFLENGPVVINRYLSNFLQEQIDKGSLKPINPKIASYQFIDMLKGPIYFQALFGAPVNLEIYQQTLEQAVEIFINGVK